MRAGMDLHALTAAGVYSVDLKDVTDAQRQVAKRLNFSIIYGGGVNTLLNQGVAEDGKGAMSLLRRYHDTWPGIGWATRRKEADEGTLSWWIAERMRTRGYVTTMWGRHLHPQEAHAALNHLCQGSAADLMKWAAQRVHTCLRGDFESRIVNIVHDELMIDARLSEVDRLVEIVPELMTYEPLHAVVPIRPEPDISRTTWAEKEPYLP